MIKVKVSLAGTDEHGKPFACKPGDSVSLDKKSESNLIDKGMAEPASQKSSGKKSKK